MSCRIACYMSADATAAMSGIDVRQRAAELTVACMVYLEESVTQDVHLLCPALIDTIYHPQLSGYAATCARLMGRFVHAKHYFPILLPYVRGELHLPPARASTGAHALPAAALSVLALALHEAPRVRVLPLIASLVSDTLTTQAVLAQCMVHVTCASPLTAAALAQRRLDALGQCLPCVLDKDEHARTGLTSTQEVHAPAGRLLCRRAWLRVCVEVVALLWRGGERAVLDAMFHATGKLDGEAILHTALLQLLRALVCIRGQQATLAACSLAYHPWTRVLPADASLAAHSSLLLHGPTTAFTSPPLDSMAFITMCAAGAVVDARDEMGPQSLTSVSALPPLPEGVLADACLHALADAWLRAGTCAGEGRGVSALAAAARALPACEVLETGSAPACPAPSTAGCALIASQLITLLSDSMEAYPVAQLWSPWHPAVVCIAVSLTHTRAHAHTHTHTHTRTCDVTVLRTCRARYGRSCMRVCWTLFYNSVRLRCATESRRSTLCHPCFSSCLTLARRCMQVHPPLLTRFQTCPCAMVHMRARQLHPRFRPRSAPRVKDMWPGAACFSVRAPPSCASPTTPVWHKRHNTCCAMHEALVKRYGPAFCARAQRLDCRPRPSCLVRSPLCRAVCFPRFLRCRPRSAHAPHTYTMNA
ncbi:hypothetical protein EON66_00535 [archaeon]|nr:MAG: hypothetical protein EON66_00535 [archaeon]